MYYRRPPNAFEVLMSGRRNLFARSRRGYYLVCYTRLYLAVHQLETIRGEPKCVWHIWFRDNPALANIFDGNGWDLEAVQVLIEALEA